MSNKVLYIIVAILVLAGVGFYVYNDRQQAQAPATEHASDSITPAATAPDNNTPATTTPAAANPKSGSQPNTTPQANSGAHFSNEADLLGNAQVHEVVYDGKSFNPPSVTIKAGDIVVFKNQSSSAFWPASDPHPTHTNYPEFDAKKPIAAGASYQFQFDKVGTWGYHNHLNHDVTGTIVVTQ